MNYWFWLPKILSIVIWRVKSTRLMVVRCWLPPSKSRASHPGGGQWSVSGEVFPALGPGAQTGQWLGFHIRDDQNSGCGLGQASGKFRAVGRKSAPVTRSCGRHKFCVITATKHPWWWKILILMIAFFYILIPSVQCLYGLCASQSITSQGFHGFRNTLEPQPSVVESDL